MFIQCQTYPVSSSEGDFGVAKGKNLAVGLKRRVLISKRSLRNQGYLENGKL